MSSSLIYGKLSANINRPLLVNSSGNLQVDVKNSDNFKVAIQSPLTAFGEVKVADSQPIVQLSFVYGVNSQQTITETTASGSVSASNSLLSVSSGASGSSKAVLSSKRFVKYRTGQGVNFKGTAIFSTGVVGNEQLIGLGDDNNGFFFGYNGETFGILHRNATTDTWISQSSWNLDVMDGTGDSGMNLNPTNGNVYSISYQWLGFGAVNFYIENPENGELVLVHRIKYANNNTTPSIRQPALPIRVSSENTSNTSNIVVQSASLSGFTEGKRANLGSVYGAESTAITGITAETPILSIRVNTQVNSIDAFIPVLPLELTAVGEGTGSNVAKFKIRLNPSTLTTPSWVNINAIESVIAYDISSTAVAGGTVLGSYVVERNRGLQVNLKEKGIELYKGDILTITCSSASSIAPDVALVMLQEDSG